MQEVERKFLVLNDDYRETAYSTIKIVQGFLNTDPYRTVRVRLAGEHAQITIKGISSDNGTTRFEWEKEIPFSDAESLLQLCEPNLIEKRRYQIKTGEFVFEVDEFYGENEGLVVAEIELETEDQEFTKPNWLGKEVTGDPRYYNSLLAKTPYRNWKI
jgi:CYTH domain-containing protein